MPKKETTKPFYFALCIIVPFGWYLYVDVLGKAASARSAIAAHRRVWSESPDSELLFYDAAYPPDLHEYIMSELSAGNEAKLAEEFSFDFKAKAAHYEQVMAAMFSEPRHSQSKEASEETEVKGGRRHLLTPSPTLSEDDRHFGVEDPDELTFSDAQAICGDSDNWGTVPSPTYLDHVGVVSLNRFTIRNTLTSGCWDQEQKKIHQNAKSICKNLENPNGGKTDCWYGLTWTKTGDVYAWDANNAGFDPDTTVLANKSWQQWEGQIPSAVSTVTEEDVLCTIMDKVGNRYRWRPVSCEGALWAQEDIHGVVCQNPRFDWADDLVNAPDDLQICT